VHPLDDEAVETGEEDEADIGEEHRRPIGTRDRDKWEEGMLPFVSPQQVEVSQATT